MREAATVGRVLAAAEAWVRAHGAGPSRAILCRALAEVLGTDRLGLLMQHERPLSADERARFRSLVARLAAGEPFAYAVGHADFHGRSFEVSPAVLIPRPETEVLVEAALAELCPGAEVFEPGTGSGCIAVTLVLERTDLRVLASDLSEAALAIARRNAARLGADRSRLTFARGDWWQAAGGRSFDGLVANPPYVDPLRTDLLDPAVAAHEPPLALYAAPGDPLAAVRVLLAGTERGLRPGAWLFVELGVDGAAAARDEARALPWLHDVRLREDLDGRPRVLVARRR